MFAKISQLLLCFAPIPQQLLFALSLLFYRRLAFSGQRPDAENGRIPCDVVKGNRSHRDLISSFKSRSIIQCAWMTEFSFPEQSSMRSIVGTRGFPLEGNPEEALREENFRANYAIRIQAGMI